MKPEITKLKNGLRVVTAEMPGSYSVSAAILVGVGSRYESYDTNGGVSHFLEHLLFKGTKKRPSTKLISEAVDGVGGINNAYTSNDLTNFYIKLPKKHFNLAIDILSDMIRNPLIESEEVDRERGVVIEEMNVYRDDPARYVHELAPPLIWPNDPMGHEVIGSEEVIKTIDRDKIADYQKLHYAPDNLVVSVCGNVRHERVVAEVERLMGDMTATTRPQLGDLRNGLSDELVNRFYKQTNQAHLVVGARGYEYDHRLDMPATVLTHLLGAGLSSRLFLNVRERLGLAYTVYSDYHNFVDTGIFEVYAGVNLDKIELALEAVMKELERIRIEKVAEDELTKVKNKMSGTLQMSLENTFALADRYGSRLLLTNRIKTVDEVLEEIEQVTAGDVMTAAQDMLAPDKLRLAVIAPEPDGATKKFTELVEKGK